jgi:hypothetical protein
MTRFMLGLLAFALPGCGSIASEPGPDASIVAVPLSLRLGTGNQRTTSRLQWSQHTRSSLAAADVTLAVCSDHFPQGSAARAEIDGAIALYNAVVASGARIRVIDEPHRGVDELFSTPPTVNHIDYVDTLAEGYTAFPCHPDKTDVTCASWVMNTCRYRSGDKGGWSRGTGKVSNFVISINRNCYKHFSDALSTDHPHVSGVAHELGHGFGMEHSTSWPDADRDLISTMQGNLTVLSAYDVAFLRHHYPASATSSHILASPRIRLKAGENYKSCYASDVSGEQGAFPRELYRDGADWKDCATGATPRLMFALFNDGTEPVGDIRGSLTVGERTVVNWTAADMDGASQDSFIEPLALSDAHFANLATGIALPATLNIAAAADSLSTQSIQLTVTLRESQAACTNTKANECAGTIVAP